MLNYTLAFSSLYDSLIELLPDQSTEGASPRFLAEAVKHSNRASGSTFSFSSLTGGRAYGEFGVMGIPWLTSRPRCFISGFVRIKGVHTAAERVRIYLSHVVMIPSFL